LPGYLKEPRARARLLYLSSIFASAAIVSWREEGGDYDPTQRRTLRVRAQRNAEDAENDDGNGKCRHGKDND